VAGGSLVGGTRSGQVRVSRNDILKYIITYKQSTIIDLFIFRLQFYVIYINR
jgi:hypothetical protein